MSDDVVDGTYAVRVDNPANVVYLESTHSLLENLAWRAVAPSFPPSSDLNRTSTWESFQKRGNELFVAGNFELAVAAYTDAIELKRKVAPKEVADLLANRAAAYLGDEKPTDAFWDCTSALFVQPGHLKATFRLAKTHSNLAKYQEAKAVLEKSPHTTRPEFKAEISRVNRLLREQQNGDYDLKALLKEAAASETPRLDHADYNGGVRVQWISKDKGNGLVAQRGFAPGDLLFVSKAFVAMFRAECDTRAFLNADHRSNVNDTLHDECVSRLIRRVSKNKDLLKELYQLFAGPAFERLTDADAEHAVVDPKRVAAIVDQNAFGCHAPEAQPSVRPNFDLAGARFAFDGCGIWILASFINHSCVPNTVIFYVGDLMIVRAAKRIRKGEELTTSYTYLAYDYAKRREALAKYGFKCACELCVCDLERVENQPHLDAERQSFMDSFNDKFNIQLHEAVRDKTKSLVKLTEDVRKLAEEFSRRNAYKNRSDPHLECLHSAVGYGYNAQRKWLQAAKSYELAYFAAVGKGIKSADTFVSNSLPMHVFFHCLNATNNYQLGREFGKAGEYLGKMRQEAAVCWGSCDKELLAMLYPGLPLKDFFEWLNKENMVSSDK